MAGYKMKSHRGASKRFRFTGKGKVKRDLAFGSHLLSSKSSSRMRHLTAGGSCGKAETRMLKKLLPY